ncbi:hypothetical protein AAFF_G00125440 [Aldrovandia affinis]|uniref:Uncharacterized protein n=1 Tax=Aldrovandia affinis TaxID=143900 RepID=A0AAD7RRV5_9TELE|nr:hypothetical protein AAFF_G00125440 [Aldrovandia affinis]
MNTVCRRARRGPLRRLLRVLRATLRPLSSPAVCRERRNSARLCVRGKMWEMVSVGGKGCSIQGKRAGANFNPLTTSAGVLFSLAQWSVACG